MSDSTSSQELKNLQNEYKHIARDLGDLQKELKHVKRGLNKTADETLIDKLLNKRHTTTKLLTIPKSETKQNLSISDKVTLYEKITGIHINNISTKYNPIYENNKLIDTSWMKYEIDLNIEKIDLQVSYITNQKIEDVRNEKLKFDDIRELDVKFKKSVHQYSLKDCLEYFYKHPNSMGMLFLCIRDYSKLCAQRRSIGKILAQEHPEFVTTQLLVDEDEVVYMNIIVKNDEKDRVYFQVNWTIAWEIKTYTVVDSYKIKLPYREENYINSISHNFEGLIKYNCDVQNSESENEKLKFLQNAMLAVKAADEDD